MIVLRSILLFVLAAVAEIGGAWPIWQGAREHRDLAWIGGTWHPTGRVASVPVG